MNAAQNCAEPWQNAWDDGVGFGCLKHQEADAL